MQLVCHLTVAKVTLPNTHTFMYQVIKQMLKAGIITASLLGKSDTTFCTNGKNNWAEIATTAPW